MVRQGFHHTIKFSEFTIVLCSRFKKNKAGINCPVLFALAKEMARQEELAVVLKGQEEERAKLLQEQKEKEDAERIEAEIRRKEELEMLKKQEQERRAKEVEKWEKEEEERLKRDEEERQERRKVWLTSPSIE